MKLEKEKLRNQQLITNQKEQLVNDLKSLNRDEIKNTIPEINKLTLWERILKTLGIS